MARSTSSGNFAATADVPAQVADGSTAVAHPVASLADAPGVRARAPAGQQLVARAGLVAEPYFSTLILFRDLPDGPQLNDAILPGIYAWRDAEPEGIVRSNVAQLGSWHSPLDMATRPEFAVLRDEILAGAESFFADFGYDPAYVPHISNMWANIHPRYGYNRGHTHPNALWSGVYYVQAPPRSGRLFFFDPRAQAMPIRPFYRSDRPVPRSGWAEVHYEPIVGRLMFFPAWLRHEVEPNLSELPGRPGDRISVSFNLVQAARGNGAGEQSGE